MTSKADPATLEAVADSVATARTKLHVVDDLWGFADRLETALRSHASDLRKGIAYGGDPCVRGFSDNECQWPFCQCRPSDREESRGAAEMAQYQGKPEPGTANAPVDRPRGPQDGASPQALPLEMAKFINELAESEAPAATADANQKTYFYAAASVLRKDADEDRRGAAYRKFMRALADELIARAHPTATGEG